MLISSDKVNAVLISFVNHLTRYNFDNGKGLIQKRFITSHLFTDFILFFQFQFTLEKGNSAIN